MPRYHIRVLEIGYDSQFPVGVAFDFWHMADQTAYSPFCMTLIQGEGHNILFDCGFDLGNPWVKDKIAAEGDRDCRSPDEVLASVGLGCDDIDALVVSHCHWDHISGLPCFPNAKVYIQRAEVEGWRRVMADEAFPATHKLVVEPSVLDTLEDYEQRGNLVWLDGDVENLFPGIHVRAASGHSFAQNMLMIDQDDGRYAVVGDVAMRPESFTGNEAFPGFLPNLKFAVGTIEDIVASYKQIMDWVGGDVSRVVLSHDGTRRDRLPTVTTALDLTVSTICR